MNPPLKHALKPTLSRPDKFYKKYQLTLLKFAFHISSVLICIHSFKYVYLLGEKTVLRGGFTTSLDGHFLTGNTS